MGPDKFLHRRILFLDHLFAWIRADSVAVVFIHQWVQSSHPGKNSKPKPCYLSKKVHGLGVYMSPYEISRSRAVQKVDLLFTGPRLANLAVQKFVQIRQSRVSAR